MAFRLTEFGPGSQTDQYRPGMKRFRRKHLSKTAREKLEQAICYFTNHHHQMDYAQYQEQGYPIGSGVTEAACRVIVKEGLCLSGMRWKEAGARKILALRTLIHTQGRWRRFWRFIDRKGMAA